MQRVLVTPETHKNSFKVENKGGKKNQPQGSGTVKQGPGGILISARVLGLHRARFPEVCLPERALVGPGETLASFPWQFRECPATVSPEGGLSDADMPLNYWYFYKRRICSF